MSGRVTAGLTVIALGVFLIARPQVSVPGQALSEADVRALAREARGSFPQLPEALLVSLAWIESSFNPTAVRVEPHLGTASVGLMQTLVTTAQWLHGFGIFSAERPTFASLTDPRVSMFWGAAYLNWLHGQRPRFAPADRQEEFLVRAYNGGPGNWDSAATLNHWRKYLAAKAELGG